MVEHVPCTGDRRVFDTAAYEIDHCSYWAASCRCSKHKTFQNSVFKVPRAIPEGITSCTVRSRQQRGLDKAKGAETSSPLSTHQPDAERHIHDCDTYIKIIEQVPSKTETMSGRAQQHQSEGRAACTKYIQAQTTNSYHADPSDSTELFAGCVSVDLGGKAHPACFGAHHTVSIQRSSSHSNMGFEGM